MLEKNVQKLGLCGMSENGATMFRNNVGQYKKGDNWVKYGLCVGSGDTIGWTEVVITPEMVGKTVAVFTSCEFKASKGGRLSPVQGAWRDLVLKAGGFSGVAKSEDEAVNIIRDGVLRLIS